MNVISIVGLSFFPQQCNIADKNRIKVQATKYRACVTLVPSTASINNLYEL